MPSHEEDLELVNAGREASLSLRLMNKQLDAQFGQIVKNAVALYRAGQLTGDRALVAIAKIDSLFGLREELEDAVQLGEDAQRRMEGPGEELPVDEHVDLNGALARPVAKQ